jgi:peptidoglycan/LPS O-acetylase OafA/YrhL
MGWMFYPHTDELLRLARGWSWRLGSGALLALGSTLLELRRFAGGSEPAPLWHLGIAGAAVWLMIFGLIGLFTRYVNRPVRIARYLSDASYWTYLVHLPVLIILAGFVAHAAWPLPVKFAVTLGGTAAACIVSYHLLARSTPIGQLLNGRKYPWR